MLSLFDIIDQLWFLLQEKLGPALPTANYLLFLANQLWLLLPIGIVGLWRWSVWLLRKIVSLRYRPYPPEALPVRVSIVTPVYNEDPEVFAEALLSWRWEYPDEIIAVIDHSDSHCIEAFQQFAQTNQLSSQLIVTQTPGKRAALAEGIRAATGEIVVLIDSDTIWKPGVLPHLIAPFKDPSVGGVGTRQNVLAAKTLAQRLFDIHLDSRYLEEIKFLAAAGDALTCLSGRTAAYRRSAVLPLLDELVNETFWGKPCISGDDKRLTHLVQAHGWRTRYQENARVYTPGVPDMGTFLKQRLRWTRNSWRADLRAMGQGWVWKKPALAFHLVDRLFQPFATLVAPIYFALSIYHGQWFLVSIMYVWWYLSRMLKLLPHLKRKPLSVLLVPVYIAVTFLLAFFKIFALFTMNEQGWITRWDKSRLRQSGTKLLRMVSAYSATVSVVLLLGLGLDRVQQLYGSSAVQAVFAAESQLPNYNLTAVRSQVPRFQLPEADQVGASNVATGSTPYRAGEGDTRERLIRKYGLKPTSITAPPGELTVGQEIQVGLPFAEPAEFRRSLGRVVTATAKIEYVSDREAIFVSGWDAVVDLPTIYGVLNNNDLLEYQGEGVYLLKVNLVLNTHTALLLESPGLSWLKLKSSRAGYVHIESTGGSIFIEGVKITSWDPSANDFDRNYKDGRSYVLVRNARMDILDSELGYLGYALDRDVARGGVYGVSWRNYDETFFRKQLTTGYVLNSRFHHNYFGLYTFGATGMVFRNNEIYENIQYGLDPHDDSNNFIVEHNYVHNNGNHGIIFSKRCFNNVIRWNRSEHNRLHGVMLDRESNGNSVYENTLIGNTDGVAIWDSHDNAIYDNTIRNNRRGVRLNAQASRNLVKQNQMRDSGQYGVYLYDGAQQNWVLQNEVLNSKAVGIYIRSTENYVSANLIQTSGYGIYLTGEAGQNQVEANRIISNTTAIYLKTQPDDLIQNNQFKNNQENIRISPNWLTATPTPSTVEATSTITATLPLTVTFEPTLTMIPTLTPTSTSILTPTSTLTPTPALTSTSTLTRTLGARSRLAPNVYARITGTDGYGASVRAGPGTNKARLTVALEDSRVLILKGPRKDENLGSYEWWFVRAENGTEGWVVQEYLIPGLPDN
ncbi:MAG: hypothetical protein BroJett011_46870 [Chloroflexota bacterium]|nr:MAG: hypothetical protein BroJett011_46870 [Chloroflexota bacterium]